MPASRLTNTPTTHTSSQTAHHQLVSDTSSNFLTPDFTPSETPQSHDGSTTEKLDLKGLLDTRKMDEDVAESHETMKEAGQPLAAEGKSSTKAEAKSQDAGEAGVKKVTCKKHPKPKRSINKRRKAKKDSSSSSDSSSDDSSDSSEDESDDEETSSSEDSEDEVAKTKRKSKARRRAKKLKEKKKARSKKHKDSSTESSEESSSDDSSSEDEKSKKARKNQKRKAKKAKKAAETDATEGQAAGDALAQARAQLSALRLGGIGGRRALGGRGLVAGQDAALKKALSEKRAGKSKSSKKKR